MDIKEIKKRLSIETPCTEEIADKRVERALMMSCHTIYKFERFLKLEMEMSFRGIDFSGESMHDFWMDNLKLQFFGMKFR